MKSNHEVAKAVVEHNNRVAIHAFANEAHYTDMMTEAMESLRQEIQDRKNVADQKQV